MFKVDNIVIVGFGSIAQALLPLLVESYDAKITIFDKEVDKKRKEIALEYSAHLIEALITVQNYESILGKTLNPNTFLLNLAVSVSSIDLIELAQKNSALYLDTCIEPWEYNNNPGQNLTSNYALREELKSFAKNSTKQSTAIVAHGANPGFISILLKKALIEMAALNGFAASPESQQEWASLANNLGIRVIQISERDTQVTTDSRRKDQFMCTWSVDGLITECLQPAELGWGTHERAIPKNSTVYDYSLEMEEQGRCVHVKSWSPNYLDFTGYLLTHNESLSIAEYLSLNENNVISYRPTVYYAYHPCDQAVESMALLDDGTENHIRDKTVLKESIASGIDELGIFLISDKYKSYWLGSNLSIGKARKMAKYNSATSLQVVSSIIAGMEWAKNNPSAGTLESEALEWESIFDSASKYWQPIIGQQIDWHPNEHGNLTFENFQAS